MQKVEVYVCISGDYCAFHETDFSVEYDVTNNIQLGDMTLEELEEFEFEEYSDYALFDAIKDGDDYYVKL